MVSLYSKFDGLSLRKGSQSPGTPMPIWNTYLQMCTSKSTFFIVLLLDSVAKYKLPILNAKQTSHIRVSIWKYSGTEVH